ncbi:unnamed protein product [Caenorhabditis auriculariae]|uniref:Uncharacterized protein n=1 Tax=Caenorhabditis auriculariae TaxID=2777116 RepID=A0A8S1HIU0_9PELO|nr:unnamed protein product [Caenorhabditis auriculariae]
MSTEDLEAQELNTVDVTIEVDDDYLDDDCDLQARAADRPKNILEHKIEIDEPISLQAVRISVDPRVRVRDLSNEVMETLCIHLNHPSFLSMLNWRAIARFFKLDSLAIEKIDASERPTEMMLSFLENHSAQKFFDSLIESHRIDTLYAILKLKRVGKLLKNTEFRGYHSVSTTQAFSGPHVPQEDYGKYILVTHFEKEKSERSDYKWFRKNIDDFLKRRSNMTVIDVNSLNAEDHGNQMEIIDRVFKQVPHIVVCYSVSYINAVKYPDSSPQARTQQYIHNLMGAEFLQNNMRNERFRAVLFPGVQSKDLIGWALLTIQYEFPGPNIGKFFERLVKNRDSLIS